MHLAARPHLAPDTSDERVSTAPLSLVGAMGIVIVEWLDGGLDVGPEEITDHFVEMLLTASGAAAR